MKISLAHSLGIIKGSFVPLAVLLSVLPVCAQHKPSDNAIFGDMQRLEDELTPEELHCRQVGSSKIAYQFISDFTGNRTEKAQDDVKQMLAEIDAESSALALFLLLYAHMAFDLPEKADANTIDAQVPLYSFLAKATEKAVGKDHRFYGDALVLIARGYDGKMNFREAAAYQAQAVKIYEKSLGKEAYRTLLTRMLEIHNRIRLKQYANLGPALEEILTLAQKHHYQSITEDALSHYVQLLNETHRQAEVQSVINRFARRRV